MQVHVALMPGEFPELDLAGRVALVVDVFRATTMVVAAFGAGCARVIPVASEAAARSRAAALAPEPVLLAGERGGDPIDGFDLGNSPLDCTPERVGGRTLVLTTTNGTRAMLKAGEAAAAALGALTNVRAAAQWAAAQRRDITVLCAGEQGRSSRTPPAPPTAWEWSTARSRIASNRTRRGRGSSTGGGAPPISRSASTSTWPRSSRKSWRGPSCGVAIP